MTSKPALFVATFISKVRSLRRRCSYVTSICFHQACTAKQEELRAIEFLLKFIMNEAAIVQLGANRFAELDAENDWDLDGEMR